MPLPLLALPLFLIAPVQQTAPGVRPAAGQTPSVAASGQAEAIRKAEGALEQNNFAEAAKLLNALAAVNASGPNATRVLYDLGFADERINDDAGAAKAYTAALALDGNLAEAHAALGLLEARANHPAEAHLHLRAAADSTTAPPDLRARALRALAELDQPSDPNAARDELLAAIKLTGEQPSDSLLTAEIAERAGDTGSAEAAYRRTLAMTPGDPDAVSGLAHALSSRGNTAEATTLLEDAWRTHPDDPRIAAQLAALYAAQGPEGAGKAVTLLAELRAKDAKLAADPSLTRQLARLQQRSGNLAEAEKLYKSLLASAPTDGPLLDDLGSVYIQQTRFAEAEAIFRQAFAQRSSFLSQRDWAETAGHLAFAASRNHDPSGALQALSARATVLPNSAASLFLEAISHDALHQNQEAVRVYRAFLTMAAGKLPDEEFQARHRIVALEHMK